MNRYRLSMDQWRWPPFRGVAVSEALQEILERIERLPAEDRLILEVHLARHAEAEWHLEAEAARRLARQRGIDQAAIDRAVEKVRYQP
jgi:hypothetical protein